MHYTYMYMSYIQVLLQNFISKKGSRFEVLNFKIRYPFTENKLLEERNRYRQDEFLNMVEYGIIHGLLLRQRERVGVSDKRTWKSTLRVQQAVTCQTALIFETNTTHSQLFTLLFILQCDMELPQELLNLVLTHVSLDRLRLEQLLQIRTSQQIFLQDEKTLRLPLELETLTRQTFQNYLEWNKGKQHVLVEIVCAILRCILKGTAEEGQCRLWIRTV
eukprot:TRINITY_DN8778_c0_g2_i1.p2 TRINITY_DN8778_c0_g2~~TRINITY_DN8778_c0_g2_i1.p2  ORF type:complete len:218 (-),score=-0.45 TRINITY_DN8778_c0_g2_i1:265-918(-)